MTAVAEWGREPEVLPDRVDVCLVNMPYASLNRPSLALGLIKALLEREGVATGVLYPNLGFAEVVGLPLYDLASAQFPKEFLAGEWTFAAAAFPDAVRDDEAYLRHVAGVYEQIAGYGLRPSDAIRLQKNLRKVREAATGFVDQAARQALATGARIIGCTSTFEQHVASLALLRRIREIDPSVVTLLGGANCESVMGRATHQGFPWLDYVVSGEADALVGDLCRQILDRGREVPKDLLPSGVFGPAHRDITDSADTASRPRLSIAGSSGEAPRPVFHELDSLPVPDFGDYFRAVEESPFAAAIRPGLPLETSRGCWWGAARHCTFCGLNGSSMTFRSKSPGKVLAEMRELEERYGIARFETVDNILDMAYFKNVLPALAAEENAGRRIFYEIKSNLRRPQVEMLKRAGISWLQPGIESLHSAVLELMDKGVQGWQNLQLLKWSRELGIRLTWNLLWGFPGEEDAWYVEMAEWFPALEHLPPPGGVSRIRYDRFSPYQKRAEDFGLALRPIPAMAHVYPLPEPDLADLSYFFAAEGRPDTFTNAGIDPMTGRPGAQAVRHGLDRWIRAFWKGPPDLMVVDDGAVLVFEDSRSCALEWRCEISGAAREVYLACDEAPVEERLGSALAGRLGREESEIAAAAEDLLRRRLLLRIDRRLVSLALRGPLAAMPGWREFPGGMVDEEGSWG
ncbi:MAG TPA: RiPP maturation radical SAM C-methyltransferase [Thermoanaerobaculia bacterium]|jgi:ribosomal peptide maturation radical SAM protein 1|nr:RiPP maturation radical SAM C-methyltransferase [Thermoanaerobaculia bacterium]